MTLDALAIALLVGGAVVLVSVLGVRVAGKLGVPGLLLYLVLGLVLGSAFPSLQLTDASIAPALGYAALVLILAQGGFTTPVTQLKSVMWPAIALASLGVAISITVVAIPLILWIGVDTEVALLIATVLAATDAAAVFSVMRKLRISERLRTLLEAEAGFNDAPVVVLVSVISSGAIGRDPWWSIPLIVLAKLIGGALVGVAIGYAARWALPRLALPAIGLYPIAALAFAVVAYGAASVLHTSGFMAVYIAAVIIGSAPRLPHRRSVIGFADGLAWIAEIGLFVMLGLLADIERLPQVIPLALVITGLIILVARPLAAAASLLPFRFGIRNTVFAGFAGLRGAVPIVFAAIPLGLGVPGAEMVFDATLLVVLALLAIQTPLLPKVSAAVGVILPGEPRAIDVESAPLDAMGTVVLGVEVPEDSGFVGTYVSELGLPPGAVVSLIQRADGVVVPDDNTRLRAGDQLMVVATEKCQAPTEARLRAVSEHGRLAGWQED